MLGAIIKLIITQNKLTLSLVFTIPHSEFTLFNSSICKAKVKAKPMIYVWFGLFKKLTLVK